MPLVEPRSGSINHSRNWKIIVDPSYWWTDYSGISESKPKLPDEINKNIDLTDNALLFYTEHILGYSESVREPLSQPTMEQRALDENYIITQPQDFLDLIGDSVSQNCNRLIIREKNLHKDFFRLHTGLAGEILQKVSNYNFKLAIIGDFSKYYSKSLQDFIREGLFIVLILSF